MTFPSSTNTYTTLQEKLTSYDSTKCRRSKSSVRYLHIAYPDFSSIIEDIAANSDIVWDSMTAKGTHRSQFGPIPPAGKQIETTVIDIMRFENGMLVEHWGVADRLAAMEQPGMKPPPKFKMRLISLYK